MFAYSGHQFCDGNAKIIGNFYKRRFPWSCTVSPSGYRCPGKTQFFAHGRRGLVKFAA
nr:MAG TPA: hypothetical protein [Caudoviricetes sp.]